jgi:hypothetical protein
MSDQQLGRRQFLERAAQLRLMCLGIIRCFGQNARSSLAEPASNPTARRNGAKNYWWNRSACRVAQTGRNMARAGRLKSSVPPAPQLERSKCSVIVGLRTQPPRRLRAGNGRRRGVRWVLVPPGDTAVNEGDQTIKRVVGDLPRGQ